MATFRIKDAERSNPRNLIAGFWLSRQLDQKAYDNWLRGDYYHLNVHGETRAGVPGTTKELRDANTALTNLSQDEADIIEMYWEAQIMRERTGENLFFATFISDTLTSVMRGWDTLNMKYLGETFSAASTAYSNPTGWLDFWPTGDMDETVLGWEDKMLGPSR